MQELTCQRCGSTEYHIKKKANNHVAYCDGCGKFIKNVPHSEPTLHFGKYKGLRIAELTDMEYMKWLLTIRIGRRIREALMNRISNLEYLAK